MASTDPVLPSPPPHPYIKQDPPRYLDQWKIRCPPRRPCSIVYPLQRGVGTETLLRLIHGPSSRNRHPIRPVLTPTLGHPVLTLTQINQLVPTTPGRPSRRHNPPRAPTPAALFSPPLPPNPRKPPMLPPPPPPNPPPPPTPILLPPHDHPLLRLLLRGPPPLSEHSTHSISFPLPLPTPPHPSPKPRPKHALTTQHHHRNPPPPAPYGVSGFRFGQAFSVVGEELNPQGECTEREEEQQEDNQRHTAKPGGSGRFSAVQRRE